MSAPTKNGGRVWAVVGLLLVAANVAYSVYAYRVGYADGARQAAPLAAPPTHTERAR